ncbi:hypothetical protein [Haladaptatus sp. DFWS20]|uniref:hypothetical protein n=1 Tax=Haladaptatus sp. DFWS20 TaxID=3403467 RepID=UPI003EBEDB4D
METESKTEQVPQATGTTVPNGSNANAGTGMATATTAEPLPDGDTPKNEWTVWDIGALLLVCLGGSLIAVPWMFSRAYTWVEQ